MSPQVLLGKLLKKYFHVVKLAQYFFCEVDKRFASNCKQEIVILKLGKLFSQTSGFVPGCQTAKCKRGICFSFAPNFIFLDLKTQKRRMYFIDSIALCSFIQRNRPFGRHQLRTTYGYRGDT